MKKIIYILVCMLLILTILPSVESINKNVIKNKIGKEDNDLKESDIDQYISKYTVMREPPKLSDFKIDSSKPIPINTPSEFSWRNFNGKDWTTPIRNQGNCGSCWAFGSLAIYESIIKIREECAEFNPDLSEQYLLSCIKGAGSCHGGNSHTTFELLKSTSSQGNYHNGIIPESCLEYEANDKIPCSSKCENWEELLVPIYDFGSWRVKGTTEDREAIKTKIMETGPVVGYIKSTKSFTIWGALNHDANDYYNNILPVIGINHVIMIFGWKDIPSITSGGYWICKNSWGDGWGYNGFFNIAYGALNIDKFMITWADYDPNSFNWSPIPITNGPYGIYLGQELNLDASKSIGIEGEILDYFWNFGDGLSSSGKNTTHSYTDLGKFTIELTVTDNKDNIGNGTTNVWVQDTNDPPNKPNISGRISGHTGASYKYYFSSTDPEKNDVWYIVKWGDDEINNTYGPFKSGDEVMVRHHWDKSGSYTIRVKAVDVFNSESDWNTLNIQMPKNKEKEKSIFFNILPRLEHSYPLLFKLLQGFSRLNFII